MGSIFYVFVLFFIRLTHKGSSSTYPQGFAIAYRFAVRYRLPRGIVFFHRHSCLRDRL